MYTTLIFDLDDTLYPPTSGVWDMISVRIHQYMIEKVGIPSTDVVRIRKQFYMTYGTTMRGLVLHHHIDPAEYLAFVHDIPITDRIIQEPRLRETIQRLPYQKFIFTNSDRPHAMRILKHLQIDDLFIDIVDVMDVFPDCKPMPQAFQTALNKINRKASECIFIDDSLKNLDEARAQGFYTILPNTESTEQKIPHATVKTMFDLMKVLP